MMAATCLYFAVVMVTALLGSRDLGFPPGAWAQTLKPGFILDIEDSEGKPLVSLERYGGQSSETFVDCGDGKDVSCLKSPSEEVRVRKVLDGDTLKCFQVSHKALQAGTEGVGHCVSLAKSSWYGGTQHLRQPWPLKDVTLPLTAFASCDLFTHWQHFGAVLERYFLSSKGVGIHVDGHVPLYVSMSPNGDQPLCLVAKHAGYPYPTPQTGFPELAFTVCQGWDMRTVHRYMASQHFRRPSSTPDARMFTSPVWSTWAQYKKNINQSAVLEFARQILGYGFSHSQLEIDDDWTPAYGDLDFDRKKFPDPAGMVKELNGMGFRVTIWVHPFMNLGSEALKEATEKGFLVRKRSDSGEEEPAIMKWWNGQGGLLDVTNEVAVDWFLAKLQKLRSSYKISSFKFDAGESLYLPENYVTKRPMTSPDEYATLWAELARKADPEVKHQEVRIAWRSQHEPIFVRMFDRMSAWDGDAGLQTIVPSALLFGLIGYPFILPDMIGGNAYSDMITFKSSAYPPKELYIRWLQATALLPAMQFSIVPWLYDDEVISLSRSFVNLHEQYAGLFHMLADESVRSGDPIIRPLWWISPSDETAQSISDEFLVGDEILVAPVLKDGARSRDVYLPRGVWFDFSGGQTHEGPRWLKDYPAPLETLPYFKILPTIIEDDSETVNVKEEL